MKKCSTAIYHIENGSVVSAHNSNGKPNIHYKQSAKPKKLLPNYSVYADSAKQIKLIIEQALNSKNILISQPLGDPKEKMLANGI